MNFICALLLLLMDEESAFWMMVVMLDQFLQRDYYTKSMIAAHTDQFVFQHFISQTLPRVDAVLKRFSVPLPLITSQWFLCAFVCMLPTEVCLRVFSPTLLNLFLLLLVGFGV